MSTTREFREEALKPAETVGTPTAKKKSSVDQREIELTTESARLKRQLAEKTEELNILKKAAAYFAKNKK